MNLCVPEPLAQYHKPDTFCCGKPVLDDRLKRRALANQVSGATRTFVVSDAEQTVRGFTPWRPEPLRTKLQPARSGTTCPTRYQ